MRELTVVIGGNTYGVRFTHDGVIVATSCVGQWDWSSVATGSAWLDAQLASAVEQWLALRPVCC